MARFEIINQNPSAKYYNVKVKATDFDASTTGLVSNGLVGKIGARLENNVYELEKLAEQGDKVFFLTTPEVDVDEYNFKKNTLLYYMNEVDEVLDAAEIPTDRKFAISEDGIEGSIVDKKGYVYAKQGEVKLQYKETLPDWTTDKAILIAKIEEVIPAVQGMYVGAKGKNLAMSYNLVKCRVIA